MSPGNPRKTVAPLRVILTAALSAFFLHSTVYASGSDIYRKHCASCHHEKRWGLSGPPLVPEYFGNKKARDIRAIVSDGLKATNMPAFEGVLTEVEMDEVVSFITSPSGRPEWGREEMLSTWEMAALGDGAAEPRYDMENFFMIVEGGAGKVHFMEGEGFTLLDSIKAGAIHGGPKFDKDLRFAYIASRDGWVIKYDLINLREVARLRTGVSLRNIAVSSDSRHIAVAVLLPDNLVIIDSLTMKPVRIITGYGPFGSVYSLRERKEFVAALRDSSELLVIKEGSFEARSIPTDQPFTDFFISPDERRIIGTSREGERISIVDLDEGKVVRTIKTETRMPHLASAAIWSTGGATLAAFPHIGKPLMTVMDLSTWEVRKEIKIKGPGFFARTHDNLAHVWADTGTDTIQLIDKKTLEVAGEVVPREGKKAMHIEFTKDGSYALISVWEEDGAVDIYDSRTLELKKSLPFRKPVGKYNATNKKY